MISNRLWRGNSSQEEDFISLWKLQYEYIEALLWAGRKRGLFASAAQFELVNFHFATILAGLLP